jgi:hypothetical protein
MLKHCELHKGFTIIPWCSTSRDALTNCIPGGTGVGNAHNVGRAMNCLSVSTVPLQDSTIIAPDCICNAFPKLCLLMGVLQGQC